MSELKALKWVSDCLCVCAAHERFLWFFNVLKTVSLSMICKIENSISAKKTTIKRVAPLFAHAEN